MRVRQGSGNTQRLLQEAAREPCDVTKGVVSMATSTPPSRNVDSSLDSLKTPTGRLGRVPSTAALSQRSGATQQSGRARHFFRHLGEMYLAMLVGMMALGMLDGAILAAAGTSVSHVKDSAPEAFALVMAFNMTVGMTVWMRYRRHSWAMCAEMAGAMFVPRSPPSSCSGAV